MIIITFIPVCRHGAKMYRCCMFTNVCINLIGSFSACHPTAGQSGSFVTVVKTIASQRRHTQFHRTNKLKIIMCINMKVVHRWLCPIDESQGSLPQFSTTGKSVLLLSFALHMKPYIGHDITW